MVFLFWNSGVIPGSVQRTFKLVQGIEPGSVTSKVSELSSVLPLWLIFKILKLGKKRLLIGISIFSTWKGGG